MYVIINLSEEVIVKLLVGLMSTVVVTTVVKAVKEWAMDDEEGE